MARTRRSRAGYSESLIKLYALASQFCYWSPAEVLTTHQPTRRAWLGKTGREPKGYPERAYARKSVRTSLTSYPCQRLGIRRVSGHGHTAVPLEQIMQSNPVTCRLLDTLPALQLPSWYVGAGAVAQAVWNHLHSFPANYGLKDYDVMYFYPGDLTLDAEQAVEAKVAEPVGAA